MCEESEILLRTAVTKWAHEGDVHAVRTRSTPSQHALATERHNFKLNTLRIDSAFYDKEQSILIFHRLDLATVGRPLWTYETELQLLRGLKDALEGLIWLNNHGITHRDISLGSVLLAESASEGPFGYITDVEYPKFADDSAQQSTQANEHNMNRESPMSGTAPFMASEVLAAFVNRKIIAHTADHDAESFAYVISCAGLKRCMILANKGDKEGRFPNAKNPAVYRLLMHHYQDTYGPAPSPAVLQQRCLRDRLRFCWSVTIWLDEKNGKPWFRAYGPKKALYSVLHSLWLEHIALLDAYAASMAASIISIMDAFEAGGPNAKFQPAAISKKIRPTFLPLTTFDKLRALLDNALQYVSPDQAKIQIPENDGPMEETVDDEEQELSDVGLGDDEEEEEEGAETNELRRSASLKVGGGGRGQDIEL